MVKRRNSRYKAPAWGAPRRVLIDCTPAPAKPMTTTYRDRTRKKQLWSSRNPSGAFF